MKTVALVGLVVAVILLALAPRAPAATLTVTNLGDSGPGTLRNLVSAANPGDTIIFATNLSGQTILLSSYITVSNSITIDASSLPNGITTRGGAFSFTNGTNILTGLNILTSSGTSGAVLNLRNLTINSCTFSGHTYGAFFNLGTATLNQCTITGNPGTQGNQVGGINNEGTLTLNQCTITTNGYPTPPVLNSAVVGGIYDQFGTVYIYNSIVAGNRGQIVGDIEDADYVIFTGTNIVNQLNAADSADGNVPGVYLDLVPNLAPLGNYGGPTKTMPPLPGSPAIDGGDDGATNLFATDQRGVGFARKVGAHVDIGAVEGVYAPIYTLNGAAFLGNGSFQFGFTNYTDTAYTVRATTNVGMPCAQWDNLGAPVEFPPGTFTITDPQATNTVQRFYRVSSP